MRLLPETCRWALARGALLLAFALASSSAAALQDEDKKEEVKKEEVKAPAGGEGEPAALLRKGDYQAAVEGFKKAAEAGEGDKAVPAVRGWAEALTAQGKYDEALAVLRSAKGFPQSAPLLAAAGRILLRKGALREAEEKFREALAIKKDDPEALNRLGKALAKQGKVDDAKAAWQKIVSLYEDMSEGDVEASPPEDFVEMGLALVGLNRFKEAQEVMFSTARDKDKKNPACLLESGRILKEKYNYPDSRDELKEAIDQNPRFADALVELADNYLTDFQVGTKRYDLAEKNLKKALEVNPNHAEAYLVRGALWLSDGNIAKGREDFKKSLELDPSSLRARGYLGACYFLDANEDALRAQESEALLINPKGAEFFHTIALAIESKFRYKDVVRFCDRALELDSDYWPAFVTLGINCLRTGEEGRGRSFLEKSWAHDNFNVWVFNTRKLLNHMDANYREKKTDRFVFKFPKDDYDVLASYMTPLLEEAYEKLSAHYKVDLPKPVYVEAFSEHKWFSARTVGLEGFAASGACFGNLVTLTTPRALPQNWGAVAWHEFAHVATLALTHHRVPRWLTEGLSVFEEGRDHPKWARNFECEIADTFASGRLLGIAELDFGFSKPKYPNQILISYFQGCLIATYIKEKWGFDSILAILKGYGDNKSTQQIFKEALGLSLEEFDKGFFDYVAKWVEKNGYEPAIGEERIPVLELEKEANPKDVKKLIDLAWAYYSSEAGGGVDAVNNASKALELDPANADAHAILGLDFAKSKNWPKAKEELEKALQGKTKFPFRAHSALATVALKENDKEGAMQHLEEAKKISPRAGATHPPGANTYYKLADLYTQAGKEEEAMKQMEELSNYAPEDPKCRTRLVSHYMKQDGEEAARKAFQALNELLYINPFEKATHEFLARAAAKLGEHDVTIREYGYLLKLPETNPKIAYLALAKAHAAKGHAEEAAAFAKKLLAIDEGNEEAKEILKKVGGVK